MDVFFTVLMICLFLLLMAFVFSISLLTPIVGKKNIFFVIGIGFIVGVVGGAFFISPISDDIPQMTRDTFYLVGGSDEVIHCNVSTRVNISSFMDNVSKIDGVKDVYTSGIVVKTDPFDAKRAKVIEDRLKYIDGNITSGKVNKKGEIILVTKKDYDPQKALNVLGDWLMYTGGINLKYSIFQVHITAPIDKIDKVKKKISEGEVVITDVDGSVEDTVTDVEKILPNDTSIVIACGIIGVIIGLIGFFIDKISLLFKNIKHKAKKD